MVKMVKCVELIASIANTSTRTNRVNHATFFTHTVNMLGAEFGGLFVESISDTVHLMEFVKHMRELSLYSTQTAEFVMFNYAARPVRSEEVLLIGV